MRNNASITRATVVPFAMVPSLVFLSYLFIMMSPTQTSPFGYQKKRDLGTRTGYSEISYISLSSGMAGTIARTDGGP